MRQGCTADLFDGIRMTEIDRYIAIIHGRLEWIAQIALCDDVDLRIGPGKIDNRFSHAPGHANE